MYEPIIGEKQCSGCKEIKQVCEFYLDGSRADGLHMKCKLCCKARSNANYNSRKLRGMIRRRNVAAESKAPWPIPTQTPADGDSCAKLRAWRGPVLREPMRACL